MADTTSPLLQLLLQQTGGNNNAWGSNLNTQVFLRLEKAVAGVVSITGLNGGSDNLAADDSLAATVFFSGALLADQTIVVPNLSKHWRMFNNCTGGFFMLVKTAGGIAVNLPFGKLVEVTCDGADGIYRGDADQVGQFFYHAGTSAPPGAFACDNSAMRRAGAVDLYAEIGTTWGIGDGVTTFNLPNGQDTGRFLRSSASGLNVGTYQANQNKAHTHSGSGNTGVNSADHTHTYSGSTGTESVGHTHGYTDASVPGGQKPNGSGTAPFGGTQGGTTSTESALHTHSFSGTTNGQNTTHTHAFSVTTDSNGGTEARPEAMVGLLCIRY